MLSLASFYSVPTLAVFHIWCFYAHNGNIILSKHYCFYHRLLVTSIVYPPNVLIAKQLLYIGVRRLTFEQLLQCLPYTT